MNLEFSYYYNGVRHTSTDVDFLESLTKDSVNKKQIIDGIIKSKARFDKNLKLKVKN